MIAVSEFEAGFLPRLLRLPPSRFVTIPNGASMDAPVDPPPADPDETLILSVGRLERYKGHHRVVAALPHLLRHEPSARLRIVGAGPFEAELREIARGNGVAERVDIGPVDPRDRRAMATLLGRASLVTLLSEYEANPVAVMEALALRRRVLLADTSGLSELARRGLARAVPLDSSPEQVARAMLDQLRSPPPSDLELPTWDACAARIADVYRSIIGLPGAASNGSRTRTATSGVTAHR